MRGHCHRPRHFGPVRDPAAIFRDHPKAIRTDNGPEFTSRAFIGWAQGHGIRHILIQPGRPMQNGYFESFNINRSNCFNLETGLLAF